MDRRESHGGLITVVLMALAIGSMPLFAVLMQQGLISLHAGAVIGANLPAVVAAYAAVHLHRASRAAFAGRERTAWRLMSIGAIVWALGGLVYAVFILTGGDPQIPAWWSQLAFLAAYPPWLLALWQLGRHQAEPRRRNWEILAVEASCVAILAALIVGTLWYPGVDLATLFALLVPATLDMLLLAGLYGCLRRASLSIDSAYPWIFGGFVLLAAADLSMSALLVRGVLGETAALAPLAGYVLVFGLFAEAARRKLAARDVVLAGERTTAATASLALIAAAPAASAAPGPVEPFVWALAAFVAWRIHRQLRRVDRSDEDPTTGFNDARALSRHLDGILTGASDQQPVGVIAVDISAFAAWNSRVGFAEGDALLVDIAERCLHSGVGPGIWGRIGADRFCWVGRISDLDEGRAWGRALRAATARNDAGLETRVAVVACPWDAESSANALAAIDEALQAAADAPSHMVAFDRGRLDGRIVNAEYSASFRARRDRIEDIMRDERSVFSVFQPIVRLSSFAVVGHEGLSRVEREPYRSPDQWIAEAHQVGYGLEIEAACIERIVGAADDRPRGTYLSVNASPHLLLSGFLEEVFPDGDLGWLVIEITEHDQVRDYLRLAERLADVRARGARVAVDDVGAGHSSLRHVMRLAPDFIKLDRSMVEGINDDSAKRALMRSMVAFSHEMACNLVAEGVESIAEMETLRNLGVRFGQGYLFRRPATDMTPTIITADRGLTPMVEADAAPSRVRRSVA